MKILYVISSLKNSGPVRVLLNIIKGLDKKCFTVFIVTFSKEPLNTLTEEIEKEGVKIYQLNLNRFAGLFFAEKMLDHFIQQINPDVIHSHGIRCDIICGKYSDRYYTISTIHSFFNEDYAIRYGYFIGKILYHTHIRAIKKISVPISISKSLSKYLKKAHNLNSSVIYNGIDTKLFTPSEKKEKKELRNILGLPCDKLIFLYAGHITELKDPFTTIKGFINAKLDNSLLVIAGDGVLMKKCKEKASEVENIIFVGRKNNIQDFFRASDFFISSSLTEGFGLVIAEALSCNLFCILTDIPTFKEITEYMESKTVSIFFKPGNHIDLTDKLKESIKLLQMKNDCSEIINRHFSLKVMSEKYSELYKSRNLNKIKYEEKLL